MIPVEKPTKKQTGEQLKPQTKNKNSIFLQQLGLYYLKNVCCACLEIELSTVEHQWATHWCAHDTDGLNPAKLGFEPLVRDAEAQGATNSRSKNMKARVGTHQGWYGIMRTPLHNGKLRTNVLRAACLLAHKTYVCNNKEQYQDQVRSKFTFKFEINPLNSPEPAMAPAHRDITNKQAHSRHAHIGNRTKYSDRMGRTKPTDKAHAKRTHKTGAHQWVTD